MGENVRNTLNLKKKLIGIPFLILSSIQRTNTLSGMETMKITDLFSKKLFIKRKKQIFFMLDVEKALLLKIYGLTINNLTL